MINNYPYLANKSFLKKVSSEKKQTLFFRIFVLDFITEKVIAKIEGKTTSGSCTFNGSSNMRRVANCALIVDPRGVELEGYENKFETYSNITEVKNLISMNKKVQIETGIKNTLKEYQEYDILWFPLGTYLIKNATVTENNAGMQINLTLNDKCALLNGDMGGTIPASTIFSESELYSSKGTNRQVQKVLLKDIVKNLVVDFGGEKVERVIVSDIPDVILKVMKWNGNSPVYLIEVDQKKRLTLDKPSGKSYKEFLKGDVIGYTLEPFVYPGVLECKAGESVAPMLEKIKTALGGNYEWFYDVYGLFHFQKKKNYINTSAATSILNISENDYFNFTSPAFTDYDFNSKENFTIIANNPQFSNIKNDFIVWGISKTAAGVDKPIRYHLAFDKKPDITNIENFCWVYKDYRGLEQALILNEQNSLELNNLNDLTSKSDKNYYYIIPNTNGKKELWHWDDELSPPDFRKLISKDGDNENEGELCYIKASDWRSELYFLGMKEINKTFAKNYYFAELSAELPKVYDFRKTFAYDKDELPVYIGGYRDEVPTFSYEYWLDFLEGTEGSSKSISQFSVGNIGRRTKVVTENNSNCIFPIEIPNYVYVSADGDVEEEVKQIENMGYEAILVDVDIFKNLSLGGAQNSAYDKIKELIYTHSNYNETIQLTCIPVYYLEPNSRISISQNNLGISGDYMINSITIPLTVNGTSQISAIKCVDKTF